MMKRSLTSLALLSALTVATASSASAADVYENWLGELSRGRSIADSSTNAERPRITREQSRSRRTRVARASISDDEDFDFRPRRSVKPKASRAEQPRRVRRQATAARSEPRPQATQAPRWTKRSLSAAGPKASGHTGVASFYWQPQRVASGGWFNPNAMTAAHKTLPFGTRVRVTHLGNGRSVEVKINDRGPYIAGRIIDLSKAAAGIIGMTGQGVARIRMEILGR
jgi:rare lipoprotein A